MTEKNSSRLVAEADREIAAGNVSAALDTLRMAAASIPWGWNKGDAALVSALISGIRRRADAILREDPSRESEVQAIKDMLVGREGGATAAALRAEPETYRAAEILAGVAYILSAISLIAGIVVGIKVSKYTGDDGLTHHHGGVVFLGIVIGIFVAALWVAISLALDLLLDVARAARRSSSNS